MYHAVSVGSCVGGLVIQVAAADAVRALDPRQPGLRADRLVAHVDIAADRVHRLRDVVAIGVAIDHHRIARAAPEQVAQWSAQRLGLDIPQCHVHRGDRAHRHRPAPPIGTAIEILPDVLNPPCVAPDQHGYHMVFEIGDHRLLAPVERRVADAVHTLRRLDLERDEIASRTGHDDARGRDRERRQHRHALVGDLHGLMDVHRSPPGLRVVLRLSAQVTRGRPVAWRRGSPAYGAASARRSPARRDWPGAVLLQIFDVQREIAAIVVADARPHLGRHLARAERRRLRRAPDPAEVLHRYVAQVRLDELPRRRANATSPPTGSERSNSPRRGCCSTPRVPHSPRRR